MLSFILKRVLSTIPVMGVVALTVFLLLRLSPGDPAAVIAGDYATAEQIEKIRTQLGLDQPIVLQFVHWLGDLAARRSRRLDLLEPAGHHADRPAHRADADARAHHDRVLGRGRGAARRARRLEGAHAGSTAP